MADRFGDEDPQAPSGRSFPGSGPAAGYLTVTTECHGDEGVVLLQGELDISSVDGLLQAMHGVLENPPRTLVVDMSGLGFADCGGLSALVSVQQRLAEQGRELVIADPQPLVRRLLAVTGLDEVFHLRGLCGVSGASSRRGRRRG